MHCYFTSFIVKCRDSHLEFIKTINGEKNYIRHDVKQQTWQSLVFFSKAVYCTLLKKNTEV